MPQAVPLFDDPGPINRRAWERGRYVRKYANRVLRPVEVLLLVRHREDFAGRVLELGCGAGRITGYLVALGGEAYGLDINPEMIAECRRRYPGGTFIQGDMRDLGRFQTESIDAVVAGYNVLDIFGDEERRATLREIGRVLNPDGLLVMSAHNRGYLPHVNGPVHVEGRDPLRLARDLVRLPAHAARHRRLRRLQHSEPDYEIVSDGSHGYSFVHYFITPEAQFRQLADAGFEPLGCWDLEGNPVAPGAEMPDAPELHYAARVAS